MTVYDELYLGCNPAHQRRMRHHKRKTAQLSAAALDGAKDAIELLLTMCGMMCLWSGLMDIAEQGGLTAVLARAFSPVLKLLFPDYKNDKETSGAICSNVTANLLGLGNAATPLGIEAMRRMQVKTRRTKPQTTVW